METEYYTVKFHFPYSTVTSDNVEHTQVRQWKRQLRGPLPFDVETTYCTYTINPSMVTYVEVAKANGFF